VRTFSTFTSGLEALAGWLAAEGVVQVRAGSAADRQMTDNGG
jgi:hypothetical protein